MPTALARGPAQEVEGSYDQAAIAFGCHPETVRKNYLKLDETAIRDAVMDRVPGKD